MTTIVGFRNQQTGEVKTINVGWSWVLFLFGGCLGIPFFIRKVYPYAVAMVGWNLLALFAPPALGGAIASIGAGIAIFLGLKGNELTAKYYLQNGWEWSDPESEGTAAAQAKWGIA